MTVLLGLGTTPLCRRAGRGTIRPLRSNWGPLAGAWVDAEGTPPVGYHHGMNRPPTVRPWLAVFLVVALCLPACRDHKSPVEPEPFPGTSIENSLVFTREDSTTVTMGTSYYGCCGLYDPSFVNERAIRIVLYDPNGLGGGWQILILVDRATAGATTTLPTSTVAPSKIPYVSIFATNPSGEWSSDAVASSGTIIVHSFECSWSTIRVDFSVNATLGSELAGTKPIRVQGTFRATLPALACS